MYYEKLLLKSGSDYKNYSEIRIKQGSDVTSSEYGNVTLEDNAETGKEYSYLVNKKYGVTLIKHDITKDIEPLPELVTHVSHYNDLMHEAMKKTVCKIEVPFDTRFS